MKHGLYLLASVSILLLLVSCTGTGELKADLGQEFTLSIGQSAQIEGENLQVRFEEVLEDSRCATGATCIWEGRVSLAVEIKDNGSPYKMVLIQSGMNDQYASETYKTYQLTFKVNPYPELGTDIATDDYQLLMTISERQVN